MVNIEKYEIWSQKYDVDEIESDIIFNEIDFKKKRIVEVGAGTGRFTLKSLSLVKYILAIEPSNGACRILKEKVKQSQYKDKIQIIQSNFETLDISEFKGTFDIVFFSWSLYHISDIHLAITKAIDLINEGGIIVISQPYGGDYENCVNSIYHSDSISIYEKASKEAELLLKTRFCNIRDFYIRSCFYFNDINEAVDLSVFFVEDDESRNVTNEEKYTLSKNFAAKNIDKDHVKLSDVVKVIVAENRKF
ncbi:class I SAM-dependent methyltransferase [Eubacterium limosum]|uniref:class I SAM-dependent methyltransferase n=1 Tax=Eubacterium limosum TaxID=1736 RepID=UPI0015588F55|nr:class I SAM-dependent methyltransferase [Eubacterium limosum]